MIDSPTFILESFALLAYLTDELSAALIEKIFEDAMASPILATKLYMPPPNLKYSLSVGLDAFDLLHSFQPPPIESILTSLLNEINNIPDSFIFVLDDYHVIDNKSVDDTLTFLIEHL